MRNPAFALVVGTALLGFTACSGVKVEDNYPTQVPGTDSKWAPRDQVNKEGVFGEEGLSGLFGGGKKEEGGGGIGVNALLWRASLDTINFMPVTSADPFGGVIITDWFAPAETPNERFKMNIYILGRDLRADGIKVAVFRQRRDATGGWADAAVESRTPIDVENAILTRARQIRQTAGR
ncbi:MAG: DUF3576 domain-containing protein [Rhodospirillales bacterium]|nr:DUF3576 domain-containing protein [Rhodospirillales bacterium]